MKTTPIWVDPWNANSLLKNSVAGLTVAVVALPLALAFGIASGLGAGAGIVSAIVAGIVASAFGGSRYQVSGPTGAMTVVLIPLAHQLGTGAILMVGFLAGLFLIAAGLARLGKHIHKLPESLIEGITAGIAAVIAIQQLGFVLGVEQVSAERIWQSAYLELQLWLENPELLPLTVALAVLAVNIAGSKFFPRLPLALATIAAASAVSSFLGLDLPVIGALPSLNPIPDFAFLQQAASWALIGPALAIALLAGLESLLSAKIADRMAADGSHHHPNRELVGQGLANLVTPLFGGVPATAALARTAVNIRSGATNPTAAILHSIFLAGMVMLLSSLVELIPLAALGGVLVATAWKMIQPKLLAKLATQSWLDLVVITATFALAVAVDLITSVVVGILLVLILKNRSWAKEQPGRSR